MLLFEICGNGDKLEAFASISLHVSRFTSAKVELPSPHSLAKTPFHSKSAEAIKQIALLASALRRSRGTQFPWFSSKLTQKVITQKPLRNISRETFSRIMSFVWLFLKSLLASSATSFKSESSLISSWLRFLFADTIQIQKWFSSSEINEEIEAMECNLSHPHLPLNEIS